MQQIGDSLVTPPAAPVFKNCDAQAEILEVYYIQISCFNLSEQQ